VSTTKLRERRLAYPILKGGPFVFNIPSIWKWVCLLEAHMLLARLPSLDEESLGLLKNGMYGREKE